MTEPRVTRRQVRLTNAALAAAGLRGVTITREMLLEQLREKQRKQDELAQNKTA
jgi:hypothetical protein